MNIVQVRPGGIVWIEKKTVEQEDVQALLGDIKFELPLAKGQQSIKIGGGTERIHLTDFMTEAAASSV
jgi:hypothetical protein